MVSAPLSRILLIEDNALDVVLFEEALDEIGINIELTHKTNGKLALEHLRESTLPDLIISDLKMPVMNGIQFLEYIKQDKFLNYIPIIILSTSDSYHDIRKCYDNQASSYLVKPVNYHQFLVMMQNFVDYYLNNVKLP